MTVWERWVGQPQTLWLRKALFQVHVWSGLGVGLYVLVISLTGSILVYRSELRQTFNPEPYVVVPAGDRLSTDALRDAAQQLHPDDRVSVFAEPEDPTHAATVSVGDDGAVVQMYFDPYTGEELGRVLPLGWRLTTWLLDLHDNLLAGETGRSVNGGGAVLLTLLSLTGAFIWWPGIRSWRRSLLVDRRAGWRRLTWNLHSVVGVWTFAFIIMWGITGVYLSFPQPFMAVVDYVEPLNLETFEPRLGDAVLYWFAYLHFGRFGGWATKVLWAVVALAPPVMFITGFLMWWNRVLRPPTRRDAPPREGPFATIDRAG